MLGKHLGKGPCNDRRKLHAIATSINQSGRPEGIPFRHPRFFGCAAKLASQIEPSNQSLTDQIIPTELLPSQLGRPTAAYMGGRTFTSPKLFLEYLSPLAPLGLFEAVDYSISPPPFIAFKMRRIPAVAR